MYYLELTPYRTSMQNPVGFHPEPYDLCEGYPLIGHRAEQTCTDVRVSAKSIWRRTCIYQAEYSEAGYSESLAQIKHTGLLLLI